MNIKMSVKIEELKQLSVADLSRKFQCLPEEICMGDYIARYTDDKVCPYKVILGFANFEGSKVRDLGLLWDVLDTIRQYANCTDHSTIVNDWLTKATDEDIAELDAQMIELLKTFEMLAQLNFSIKTVAPKQENVQKDVRKVAAVSPDKALGDFLKMMGW